MSDVVTIRSRLARFHGENSPAADSERGVALALQWRVMPPRLVRLIAVALVVLGASPFSAPFSMFDLTSLSGQHHQSGPAANPTPHSALLKTAIDPDKAPVLAAAAPLPATLFGVLATDASVRIVRIVSVPVYLQSLRI